MESGGGVAKLTLTHLAKDDEGLYTLRMVTKGGDAVHKAYIYVEGKRLWAQSKGDNASFIPYSFVIIRKVNIFHLKADPVVLL